MTFERHHFHFFGNREMTSLYFALGLLRLGEGLVSFFVPIYLWELGMPLWRIIFFYFLVSLYFVFLAFPALPIIKKLSDKMMMFLSIPFVILYFLGLGKINDYSLFFYGLPLVHAVNILLFNVGYHMDFSGSADKDSIGREVGMQHMLSSLVALSAPFLGGIIIVLFGFEAAFLTGSLILLLATLPLFFFPQRRAAHDFTAGKVYEFLVSKRLLPFTVSGIGFATEKMVSFIVWPLFLFLNVGTIKNFGGLLSLGLLAGAVITFLVGYLADQGKRRRVLMYSAILVFFLWVWRYFIAGSFGASLNHILGSAAGGALMVAWSSQYYKIARALPDASPFILSRETLYHIARVLFLPILMALAYFLAPSEFFGASFIIAAALTLLFLFANRMPHLGSEKLEIGS